MTSVKPISTILLASSLLGIFACGGGSGPPTNVRPIAQDATYNLDEDTLLMASLSGEATEGGDISYQIQSVTSSGELELNGEQFVYLPADNFFGTDSFTFIVVENNTNSSPATITLNVEPVNDAPMSQILSLEIDEDNSVSEQLPVEDIDSTVLTHVVNTQPENGVVEVNEQNIFIYTPTENFFGKDHFEFTSSDGELSSALATVNINVQPVNDAPVIDGQLLDANAGEILAIELIADDVEEDILTFEILENFDSVEVSNDPSTSGVLEVIVPYGTYGEDSLEYVAYDGNLNSESAIVTLDISVPLTQANPFFYQFDAAGEVVPLAIGNNSDGHVFVLGNVNGVFDEQSSALPEQHFIAVHNSDNLLEKVVYFEQTTGAFTSAAILVNDEQVMALGVSGTEATFVKLAQDNTLESRVSLTLPYELERQNRKFTVATIPGVGFYVLGNDNQLSWVDSNGELRATAAIDNPAQTNIHSWLIDDVKIIEEVVYIAGRFLECSDSPLDCFAGSGKGTFLLKVNQTGVPQSFSQPLSQWANDLAILDDGSVAIQSLDSLFKIDVDGNQSWLRSNDGGSSGQVVVSDDNEIFWWNLNTESGDATVSRMTSDNTLKWQSTIATEIMGSYWKNEILIDEYGNLFVNFIDRYNDTAPLGSVVTMMVDYSGVHHWTLRSEPGDLNPNIHESHTLAVLTKDRRVLSIAKDNINASGSETDGYIVGLQVEGIPLQ